MRHHYGQDVSSALEAITEAQRIAFAPMLFQTAIILRDTGILAYLDKQGKLGATLEQIAEHSPLNEYAVGVLLDMGLSGKIIYQQQDLYFISKTGYFLQHDTMTRINMDFTQHVCYQGLFHLKEALEQGAPAGLRIFGDWPTIYPALSQLPEPARSSWFNFDHYYSDSAFNAALQHIFALQPHHIYDVGGNTGKWALRCCRYDDNVRVTILDLPEQISLAEQQIAQQGLSERIHCLPVNMLDDTALPNEADIWWMSQFLDCFSPQQIVTMLRRVAETMQPGNWLCIMELFWDAQKFEAASFSLNASSLYFTCMANGYSRFYSLDKFKTYIAEAGLTLHQQVDDLGVGHTLLICKK